VDSQLGTSTCNGVWTSRIPFEAPIVLAAGTESAQDPPVAPAAQRPFRDEEERK